MYSSGQKSLFNEEKEMVVQRLLDEIENYFSLEKKKFMHGYITNCLKLINYGDNENGIIFDDLIKVKTSLYGKNIEKFKSSSKAIKEDMTKFKNSIFPSQFIVFYFEFQFLEQFFKKYCIIIK